MGESESGEREGMGEWRRKEEQKRRVVDGRCRGRRWLEDDLASPKVVA